MSLLNAFCSLILKDNKYVVLLLYLTVWDILVVPTTKTSILHLFSASDNAGTNVHTLLNAEKLN
jgi:hypothetical protein